MAPGRGPSGLRAQVNAAYVLALESAGLAPVLVAPHLGVETTRATLACAAGLVLTGGADIDPQRYGEPPGGADMETVSALRDSHELSLARIALEADLPLLAICRGMQVVNVLLGGSLIQDIAAQIPGADHHRQSGDRGTATHVVDLEPGSTLALILGTVRVPTNSLHHQAIARLGWGVRITGRTCDGVIEAIELEQQRWAVGVQWHPEEMAQQDDYAQRLFAGFAQACIR